MGLAVGQRDRASLSSGAGQHGGEAVVGKKFSPQTEVLIHKQTEDNLV